MIALWYDGKYYDTWFNTLADTDFIEVSIVQLNLNPALCEWVEYGANPNGHNPKQVNNDDKSFEWITDTIVPQAIVEVPDEIAPLSNKYYKSKVFAMMLRILNKQNEILEKNFLDGESIPDIPTQYLAPVEVTNKVVMNPMQKLTVSDVVMVSGERKKLYTGEIELPPKLDSLKKLAVYLLSKNTKWNSEFLAKLNSLKG